MIDVRPQLLLDILDVLIVAFLFYRLFAMIKGTRASQMFVGLVVIVFGLVAYPRIGVDQFPDIDFPIVTVTTVLPGADPEAIEKTVTDPLEEVLNTLPGLDTLRSVNVDNVSQIIVKFDL